VGKRVELNFDPMPRKVQISTDSPKRNSGFVSDIRVKTFFRMIYPNAQDIGHLVLWLPVQESSKVSERPSSMRAFL
jgi:hypothetical protein